MTTTDLSNRIDDRRALLRQADQAGDDDTFSATWDELMKLYERFFEARRREPKTKTTGEKKYVT